MAKGSLLTRILFTACTFGGLWLLGEGIVTFLYAAELEAYEAPVPEPTGEAANMPGNPYLIYEIPPGERFEQGVTMQINSMGLRGEEPATPKPAGVRRFLTTGDSSVFGFGVEDDEVFHMVADAQLPENVEGMTAAIPGYSSFQSINLLRMRALETEPDLLVVANLWSDNNFDGFVDKELLASFGAYEQSLSGSIRNLLAKSAIFRILDWRLRVRDSAINAQQVSWMLGSGDQIGLRRVAIQDYAQNLETLVQIALDHDAEVMFVVLSNNEDLGDSGPQERKAWTPYRDVMRETAARHGAQVLEVPPLFQESGLDKPALFLDEMHPTAKGHQLMGLALAELLAERDWANGGNMMEGGTGGPVPDYRDPFVDKEASPGAPPEPGALSPGEGGAGPAASGDPNVGGRALTGTIVFEGYEKGAVLLDAIPPNDPNPQVIASVSLAAPGPFALACGKAEKLHLRAYLDLDSNGPDGNDVRIDLENAVLELPEGGLAGIVVDLDARTVSSD